MKTPFILSAALAIRDAILAHESELESLDRAIGDGDHYINMKRGANSIVEIQAELATLTPDAALHKIGLKLLSTIGGASGPLLASFFMGMAKVLETQARENKVLKENGDDSILKIAAGFAAGVKAIIQQRHLGIKPKTPAPVVLVADHYADLGRPVQKIDLVQADAADK